MVATVQRKLTTILAADAAGYSTRMEADEIGTLTALRSAREVFAKLIERHRGRIANTAGDGLIAEFPSVVEAVQCAVEVQRELTDRPGDPQGRLEFRIGIHLGDVIVDGEDLLGEGVNLAARLQAMAAPGDILISQQVYDQVNVKLSVGFDYLGDRRPKNFARDVPVYRVAGSRARPDAAFYARPPEPAPATPAAAIDLPAQRLALTRLALILGAVWIGLALANLVAGGRFWAFWPGVAALVVLGLKAAPLLARGWLTVRDVRLAVGIGALALVNLHTWSGYPWVLWPLMATVALALIRRFSPTSD